MDYLSGKQEPDALMIFTIIYLDTIRACRVRITSMALQLSPHKQILDFLYPLFWEYDPATLDIAAHADLIIGRIMEQGDWAAMRWLRQTYPLERLVTFLEGRGRRILPPRELNYWALVCGVDGERRRQWVEDARNSTDVWRTRTTH